MAEIGAAPFKALKHDVALVAGGAGIPEVAAIDA
jgi:hypothetical protein